MGIDGKIQERSMKAVTANYPEIFKTGSGKEAAAEIRDFQMARTSN